MGKQDENGAREAPDCQDEKRSEIGHSFCDTDAFILYRELQTKPFPLPPGLYRVAGSVRRRGGHERGDLGSISAGDRSRSELALSPGGAPDSVALDPAEFEAAFERIVVRSRGGYFRDYAISGALLPSSSAGPVVSAGLHPAKAANGTPAPLRLGPRASRGVNLSRRSSRRHRNRRRSSRRRSSWRRRSRIRRRCCRQCKWGRACRYDHHYQ